jgi:hypothetical protein
MAQWQPHGEAANSGWLKMATSNGGVKMALAAAAAKGAGGGK